MAGPKEAPATSVSLALAGVLPLGNAPIQLREATGGDTGIPIRLKWAIERLRLIVKLRHVLPKTSHLGYALVLRLPTHA